MNAANQATLGVVFDTTDTPAELVIDGERLAVAGYVWEPTTELVAVDGAGAVWSCAPEGGRRVLMNSSVDALRRFLDLFGQFFAATPARPPTVHTAEQMAAKLAAFRRGEIKPAAPRPDDRPARIRQLKKALRELDRPAVKAGWWSAILEQVDDGIL